MKGDTIMATKPIKNDFIPIKQRENIFAIPDWANYDYQAAISNDPELQAGEPVGREAIDQKKTVRHC